MIAVSYVSVDERVPAHWTKTISDLRTLSLIGLAKICAWPHWNFAAYNLIRLGGIGQWWHPSTT
jgi:hypothetical protein